MMNDWHADAGSDRTSNGIDPRRLKRIGVGVGVVFLAVGSLIVYAIPAGTTHLLINNLFFPLVAMAATLSWAFVARRTRATDPELSRAWWVLTVAQFCWFLGDTAWLILESVLQIEAYPSVADGFYLAYYAFFLVGVLLLPGQRRTRYDRAKRALDAAAVFVCISLLYWVMWLGPLIQAMDPADPVGMGVALGYPIGDLVLVWAILTLLVRHLPGSSRGTLILLGLSAAIGVVFDLLYALDVAHGTYVSGGFVDLGWLFVMVASLWAGIWQAATPVSRPELPEPPHAGLAYGWQAQSRRILPYLNLVGVLALQVYARQPGRPAWLYQSAWVLDGALVLLVLLLSIRQILTQQENVRLTSRLLVELNERQVVEITLREEIAQRERMEAALRQSQAQVSYDAVHDAVTGLPNRVLFTERLHRTIERNQREPEYRFAVLFLDLDAFKVVNDSFGHAAGDVVLQSVAQRLQNCVRASDTLARFGGDEFVVLLDHVQDPHAAIEVADRIQAALARPIDGAAGVAHCSASIGVRFSGVGPQDAEDLIRDADLAMYQAKEAGKDRYALFDARLGAQTLARNRLGSALRGAIERDELRLVYQPIVDHSRQRVTGVEALLRWRHPRLGNVSPAEFIPIAEETGVIVPMGWKVLQDACQQMATWRKELGEAGSALAVNVNLSPRQFQQPDLVEQVSQALRQADLAAEHLNIEVTESVIMADAGLAVTHMHRLREIGVGLHIDDFGTGYSSLSYLHQFPIGGLKIDRAFVTDLEHDDRNRSIVETIVVLAHHLGLRVVAEGVETPEQASLLESLACDRMQGFWISRPLEANEVRSFVIDYLHDGAPRSLSRRSETRPLAS